MIDAFKFGPRIDLMSLPEEEAIAILGKPIYDTLRNTHSSPSKGSFRVTSVDRTRKSITMEWAED